VRVSSASSTFVLPPDPFWLLRVKVPKDGDCVPYHFWLLYHWQFQVPKVTA
jgi:hypothetical protein